jgi:GDP-4-dehydro-6-deoxy-D-mannose reductase
VRILITGAGGFAGRHLAAYLRAHQPSADLHGTTLNAADSRTFPDGVQPHSVDLRDPDATHALIGTLRPTHLYHLAGSANVRNSFETAWTTIETNARGTLNLIEACVAVKIAPRILVVTSGDIYGELSADQACIDESAPLNPTSPYAVSKIAQDMLILPYVRRYKLPIIRARAFNHIGRGQQIGFAVTDFASQIARIESGLQAPVVTCRNSIAERDFTDVRDVVRAYALLMEHGTAGDAYHVASGHAVSIHTILETLIAHSIYDGTISVQAEGVQRTDRLCGDSSKLRALTGWTPQIPLDETLCDVLDDWRARVAEEQGSSL